MIAQELEVSLVHGLRRARSSATSSSPWSTCCWRCSTTRRPPSVARAPPTSNLRKSLTTFIGKHSGVPGSEEIDAAHAQPSDPARIMRAEHVGQQEGSRLRAGGDLAKDSHAVYYLHRRASRGSTSSTTSRTASPRRRSRRSRRKRATRGRRGRRQWQGAPSGTRRTSTPPQGRPDRPADQARARGRARVQVLCRRRRGTTRCWSARPASARPPSPRVWPGGSRRATCPKCSPTPPSTRSTWVRCWPARNTAAISSSA